ncbi:mll2674 [Mesorhizobium japonicum MAFF 303099]|uniref:Mll2674 protein n=18 Tax=Pseudomonadota TaxID=1224 RepID=Q98HX1_RHILO|nr:mll2674 [Mesorhizobium japonicum MAFF 303099]
MIRSRVMRPGGGVRSGVFASRSPGRPSSRSDCSLCVPSRGACGGAPQNDRKHSMELLELEFSREIHPVDVIEQVAHNNDWSFERAGDDEISISVAGSWTDYHVSFSWMEDFEALHLACAFDIKVPETRALEVMRLLSLINEQMLFGHFDLWEQEGAIMFRQSLLLAGGVEPSSQQVEVLLSSALEACECYFQAFQFVVWSGTSAKDALAGVLFETYGNA